MKKTNLNFDFAIDEFMIYCESKNLSKKTMEQYEQCLSLLGQYLQNNKNINNVSEVTESDLREYINYVKERGKYTVAYNFKNKESNIPENRKDYGKKVSITTVNNYIRNIKVFFNYLKEMGYIKKDIVKNIKLFKNEHKPVEFITDEEVKRLLHAIDTTKFHERRDYICILLLLDTGCRIGECLNINVDDIDLNNRAIYLPADNTKGKKSRYVYFSQTFTKDLRRWLQYKDRYIESDLLFCTTTGKKVDVRTFEQKLKNYGRRVGLDIHPHQLRNNFAKRFLMNHGSIFTLSKILGHSSVKTTEKAYLDLNDEDIRKSYQQFSPLESIRKGGRK